jgi:eukaryotic-like serine/threonine-protein kinase
MASPRPLLDDEGQPSSGSPVQIGQIINGKYRIERQIGRGGMGIVLAATHLQLEHLVAIKVMRRDLVVDDKALDRLLMEARSAARIRSEHVARVLDVGTLDVGLPGKGSPFIVMEYLEGENLADLLDREGALDVGQAASFLMQCCLALAEVHVAEMVHRDLKPGNLFIARLPDGSPTVKIVDFGISKHIGSARDHAATTSPQVLGSPFYMSPEQMRAEAVDERSDIWGLGAILFEMLTGRPPFIGDTLPEVYSAVLNDAPPAVDSLRQGVPGGLDDVVQRCLEKDPAQRFCDVADLAEALAPYAGATAAQSVERITRILTNPDAVRARYSLLPPPAAMGRPSADGSISGGSISSPGGLPSAMLGAGDGSEGIMAGEADGGGSQREQRTSRVDVGAAPAGGTWLEPGAAELRERSSWRPSRPALSGEFTPLSATGIHTGRVRRGVRARFVALAAALVALGAVGFFWLRGAPAPEREPPAVPVVKVLELTPPGGASAQPAASAEPRVTPIVQEPGAREAEPSPSGVPRAAAPAAQRAKPDPGRPSPAPVPPRRGSSGGSEQVAASREAPAETAANAPPEPGRAPAPERPAMAHGDDPWNPDSFGERR